MVAASAVTAGDIHAGNPQRAAGTGHSHDRVENGGRLLSRAVAVTTGLETDSVDGAIDLVGVEDVGEVGLAIRALSSAGLVTEESSPGCGLAGLDRPIPRQ